MHMTSHKITHPSGETSTRKSATTYTHAVVASERRAERLAAAREHYAAVERAIEIGALKPSEAKAAAKKLARLESSEHPMTFTVVSWHGSREAAERKARTAIGERVVEVEAS
jgi:hypothetical protein